MGIFAGNAGSLHEGALGQSPRLHGADTGAAGNDVTADQAKAKLAEDEPKPTDVLIQGGVDHG